MENYLLNGKCSISNNAVERAVKSYVMGRKNFLFYGTVKGAKARPIPLATESNGSKTSYLAAIRLVDVWP